VGISEGWLSINQVRKWEDMPAIQDSSADSYRMPLNEADSELAAARIRSEIYVSLVGSGMAPAEAKKVSGL